MRKMDLTQLGGLHAYQDTLEFLQTGYYEAFAAIAAGLGDKLIITGVNDLGATISDGWVVISGELMPFVGGPKSPQVMVEDVKTTESFDDGSVKEVYLTRRAIMGAVGGFPFTDLRRWKTDAINLDDSNVLASAKSVKKLYDNLLSIISFESTIILKGCEVSNVNSGASTLDIAAGVVMIDNNIVNSQAYAGAYPAYLKPDGSFDTVQPAGSFIKFDPHTSQRYSDVLKRATTSVGEIKTYKTLSDRFDNNGVGKWEMLGFKICDDLQSRVALGYDRRQDANWDSNWDAAYNIPGSTGGEKKHTLTINEMPAHDHDLPDVYNEDGTGSNLASGNTTNNEGGSNRTGSTGGGQAHENRQPFRVVVFVERI